MNYINRIQNPQAFSVSVQFFSKDQLMHIFLDNLHQGGKYSAQIESHQEEFKIEEKFTDKKIDILYLYILTIKILTVVQVLVELM